MRYLCLVITAFVCLCSSSFAKAQKINDPTTWNYELKKIAPATYEVIFHVTLKPGWHIFSLQPGDEFIVPPRFHFENDPNVSFDGKVEQRGKLITSSLEGVGKPVNYFESSVDFVFTMKLLNRKPLKVVTGDQEYQVCNDKMCMPPIRNTFVFELKD
jgi:hypothetical protein